MTTAEKLMQMCGRYTLPFLVRLYTDDLKAELCFVNDTESAVYGGKTYLPGAFEYTPAASSNGFDGGGTLTVAARGNKIIPVVDTYTKISLEVTGALKEDGTVEVLEHHSHAYGSVEISGGQAKFTFEKDRRLSMQFPALVWSRYNNRGNS